jgi:ActR/RegA family two-component response regulator
LNLPPSRCIAGETVNSEAPQKQSDSLLLADVTKDHILRVLKQETGNKSSAARELGVSRKTLERKLASWEDQG